MTIADSYNFSSDTGKDCRSAAHSLALAAVWLTMVLASIVFREPAPFDLMMGGLLLLLPLIGLVRITPHLLVLLSVWLCVSAFGFVSALWAVDTTQAATHTLITLYLAVTSVVIAGFVICNPTHHARLIASGLVIAALIASLAGIIGYMDLFPGSYDLLTNYGRARGTFKDPNVLGAFLTATIVLAFHMSIHSRGARRVMSIATLGMLSLALLLSFSRAGWMTTFATIVIYLYLCILVAPSNRHRMHLIVLTGAGIGVAALVLITATQFSSVSTLLAERASLSQNYDLGPDGRFGGQVKAMKLILQYPMGIGALEFYPRFHHEEPHNAWLGMFLNAGWAGGLGYLVLTLGTAVYGFRHITKPGENKELFVALYAGYLGTLMGGLVVDSDHWRHFFILLGLVWGLMLAPPASPLRLPTRRTAFLRNDLFAR